MLTPDFNALRHILHSQVPDDLLRLALTHPSAIENEPTEDARTMLSNQRLEFLGDAVVGMIVAAHLYQAHAELPEGTLTQRKAAVVKGATLANAARRLELGQFLILGRGEENSGGREREGILADVFEALTGALFLSVGFEPACDWVLRALKPELEAARDAVNVKNRLQERTQAAGLGTPVYRTAQQGKAHRFTSEVLLQDEVRGSGQGGTKKDAECRAAEAALRAMETASGVMSNE